MDHPTIIACAKQAAAQQYGVTVAQIDGKRNTQAVVDARHTAIYLARRYTKLSTTKLAEAFGGRNHGTIFVSLQRAQNLIETDQAFRDKIIQAEAALKEGTGAEPVEFRRTQPTLA